MTRSALARGPLASGAALGIAFCALAGLVVRMQIGRGAEAEIWDDAMFFRRVAYNVLHHGFAGWNQSDGPVFVNTSQLYQTVTIGLLAIAPRHFNAATVVWAAACLGLTFALMPGRSFAGRAVTFVGLQAPPIFMAIATGMDTCTVLLVLAAFLRLALRRSAPRAPAQPALLAAMSLLVYLARPDALVLAAGVAIGLLAARADDRTRRLATYCFATGAGLAVLSVSFRAYYGTVLPLATYVKLNPVSVYDPDYIALGWPGKLASLRLASLLLAGLAPFIAMRLDRANIVLSGAGLAFIAFHAATTNEIMGYHARFYAPALPLFVCAAARGSVCLTTRRRRFGVVTAASGAALLAYVAYARGWVENATLGSYLDRTPLTSYFVFFLGLPIVALVAGRARIRGAPARIVGLAALTVVPVVIASVTTLQKPFRVVEDDVIYTSSATRDGDLVGIDTIRGCFEEPLKLTHSELGVPGVLFPESKIIDYTGLANPSIIDRSFDFERLCRADRPDFVFRPHRTHRTLNEELSASRCLAEEYTPARLRRRSACPLYVRNDHVARFEACVGAGDGP